MLTQLKKLFHFHSDSTWQVVGCNRYYICRCGAKRVSRADRNMASPEAPGWPILRDEHNVALWDSGWRHEGDATSYPVSDIILYPPYSSNE